MLQIQQQKEHIKTKMIQSKTKYFLPSIAEPIINNLFQKYK
jgi:hypothetical protein